MLKVCKFGGSSLADAAQFQKVKNIIEADPSRRIVVVSAPGKRFSEDHKLTDLLYLCHAHLQYGVPCDSVWAMITERFLSIRNELGISLDLEAEFSALRAGFSKKTPVENIVSRGEYFSARLMAAFLDFRFVPAEEWLVFHGDGTIDTDRSYGNLRELYDGSPIVTPGFYGALPDGALRLLDRGGSDITGALAAAALGADVYENWTDVSGILMADPRIVEGARSIPKITYSELRELSYIGAQVLHEDSVFPVRAAHIPLNIRNTNEPENPGTMISEDFPEDGEPDSFITGIAGRKGFAIVTVTKNGLSSAIGEFRKILGVFETFNIPIHYMSCGIDCLSLVVEESILSPVKYGLADEIGKTLRGAEVKISENFSVLAVVGRRMVHRTGSAGKILRVLGENRINIRIISQGPEELNIIIGVHEDSYNDAVRALYKTFVSNENLKTIGG